ncbi:hypothetical protein TWF718_007624 [Orbilia javanica]|uniref:F-box domain-containing protein n=1 Tax=Orbilia javanica TaxID=47235 RepID=A0AAN8RIK3_9PEZI
MPQPVPTGVHSLPVEIHIMILSYLSYLDHIACETVLPVWYSIISDPATFSKRYTKSKLRYTMTHPDERYLIHQLLRDCYFIVHSESESKKAIRSSDSITVTLVPVASISPKESEQYPDNLFFLDANVMESRLISSIPGAMTLTNAPFLNEPVWIDQLGLASNDEPDCNIWFYPANCGHKLGSVDLAVKNFTLRDMLIKCISYAESSSKLVSQGCSECWDVCEGKDILHIPEDIKPIYLQQEHYRNWTYRNPRKLWLGIFAFERYFVNVQDINDGEICGKMVKPWHWTSFWNQIVYDATAWVPTKEGSSCVLLGLDDIKTGKDAQRNPREGGPRWF